jgi:hypothetical protein
LDVLTSDIPRPVVRPQFYPPVPPLPARTNPKAIASLVISLVGWGFFGLGSVLAVGLGHRAKKEIRQKRESGDGLATAGLVLGYLSLAGWALFYVLGVFPGA